MGEPDQPTDPGTSGVDASGALSTEALLDEVQKLAGVGYARLDLRSEEVTGSDEFYRIWGLDPDDAAGSDLERFLGMMDPDDRQNVEDALDAGSRKRDPTSATFRIRRPDGEEAWISARFIPEVEDGEAVAVRSINKDVTERKELEEQLREGRRRLEEAQRVADVGSWEWHVPSGTVTWSDEQYRLLGREPGDPPAPTLETVLEAVHPEDRERVEDRMEGLLETGMFTPFEYRVELPDGSTRLVEARGTVEVEDDDVVRVTGTTVDITDRVLPLRRYEAIVDTTSDAIVQADEEGLIVGWNRAAEEMFGWSEDEILGEPLTTIMPEAYRERHREGFRRYLETGEGEFMGETVELEGRRADGEVFPVELSLDSYTLGDTRRFCGIIRDVTDRREVERELEEERRRLKEAQRVANVGSWEWHVPSDSMTFSDEKYRLLGLDPDEAPELDLETLLQLVHPEDRGLVEGNRRRALEDGEYPTIEWRTNPEFGPPRWIREEGEAVVEDGEVVLVRGTALDVTQQKGTMEELEEARDAAVAANEAKSQFLANTSHEIRTPMNAIMGLTDLLLDTDLTEDQRDQLETVEASAKHLLSIINDLLDLSQLETGQFDLDYVPFDLRETVEESFELLETTSGQEGLNLAYRYEDDVPEGIHGDPQRLRQILVNLLSNAVKFTGEGEVVLRVDVAEDGAPDDGELFLVFEVEDTGKGIPEEAMETLFDPYSQAEEGLTTTAEGTGLGLSIARQLVETMGGSLKAESVVGRGSTFRFSLPTEPAELVRERPWMGPVEDFAGARYLVVDDNETNREIIEDTVSEWGVEVTLTSSAEEALELLASDKDFDLVLVDYHMPGLTGIEFADRVRSDPELAEVPMILHTSMQESQQEARRSGADFADVLVKPVSPSDLFEASTRVLRGGDESRGPEDEGSDADLGEELGLDVLLAEDNPVNRKVVVRILGEFGLEVDRAVDGEEVLEKLRERDYDLILMDLQMPRLNGLEATEAIRSEFPADRQPHIVALTAHAASSDRERCMEAGMDGYLSKPVSPDQLEDALRKGAAAIGGG